MQERDLPPITRQLRDSIRNAVTFAAREEFDDLCDAIDSVHRSACTEWATMRAERDSALAALDRVQGDHDTDGWVELPVDADGVTIRAGDKLDGYGKTIEVVELRYGRSGWVLISRDGNGYADTFAFTHHHEQTVEDLLREFAAKLAIRDGFIEATEETFAEYAAKLREVMPNER